MKGKARFACADPWAPRSISSSAGLRDIAHEAAALEAALRDHQRTGALGRLAWTAWFLHFRTVLDIFQPSPPKNQDDLWVGDFVGPDGAIEILASVPRPGVRLDKLRQQANKLAAHPTHTRAKLRGKSKHPNQRATAYCLALVAALDEKLKDHPTWQAKLRRDLALFRSKYH